MHEFRVVSVPEPRGKVPNPALDFAHLETSVAASLDDGRERLAIDVFHDNGGALRPLREIEEPDDLWIVHCTSAPRLQRQIVHGLAIVRQEVRQELEGDRAL